MVKVQIFLRAHCSSIDNHPNKKVGLQLNLKCQTHPAQKVHCEIFCGWSFFRFFKLLIDLG